jgi:hypothetical protein
LDICALLDDDLEGELIARTRPQAESGYGDHGRPDSGDVDAYPRVGDFLAGQDIQGILES